MFLYDPAQLWPIINIKCFNLLQHGRRIETETIVLDLENLSIQRHYYWPAIEMFYTVSNISMIMIIVVDWSLQH